MASLETFRKRLSGLAFAIGLAGIGVVVIHGATPIPVGLVYTGAGILINGFTGMKSEPSLSAGLAAYTDHSGAVSQIRYYKYPPDNVDLPIPLGTSLGDSSPAVSGERIAFSRVFADRTGVMVFDVPTQTTIEIAPAAGFLRTNPAIGGNTVAWVQTDGVAPSHVFVYDLSAGGSPVDLGALWQPGEDAWDSHLSVAPGGNAVIWDRYTISAGIMKSVRTGGIWGAPQVVVDDIGRDEMKPDTDGTWIAYQADTTTDTTICFVPLAGGAETCAEMPGVADRPSISNGVIAFAHTPAGATQSDLDLYWIQWNLLFQVADVYSSPIHDIDEYDLSFRPSDGVFQMVWPQDYDDVSNIMFGVEFIIPGIVPPSASQPPTIAKAFAASAIILGTNTTLTFTLTNPNTTALTGVGFTDPLPQPGLIVGNPNGLTNTCGGTVTAVPGATSVTLADGTLAGTASCTVSVTVLGNWIGTFTNTTGQVTSAESGPGDTASANITVQTSQPPSCHGSLTSSLAQLYHGLRNASVILGYGSVPALQDAIQIACSR